MTYGNSGRWRLNTCSLSFMSDDFQQIHPPKIVCAQTALKQGRVVFWLLGSVYTLPEALTTVKRNAIGSKLNQESSNLILTAGEMHPVGRSRFPVCLFVVRPR